MLARLLLLLQACTTMYARTSTLRTSLYKLVQACTSACTSNGLYVQIRKYEYARTRSYERTSSSYELVQVQARTSLYKLVQASYRLVCSNTRVLGGVANATTRVLARPRSFGGAGIANRQVRAVQRILARPWPLSCASRARSRRCPRSRPADRPSSALGPLRPDRP